MTSPFIIFSSINKNLSDIYSGYKQSLLYQKTLLITKEINADLLEALIFNQLQTEKKFDWIKDNIEELRLRIIKDNHNKITHELQIRIIDSLTDKYCDAKKRAYELEAQNEELRVKLKKFYLNTHPADASSNFKCKKAEKSRHVSKNMNKSEASKDPERSEQQQSNIHINFNYKPITNVQIFHDNASKNPDKDSYAEGSPNISSLEIEKYSAKNLATSMSTPLLDKAANFTKKNIEVKTSNSTEVKRDESADKSANNLKNYSKYRKNKNLEAGAVIFPESKTLAETKFVYDISGQSSTVQNKSKSKIHQNTTTPSRYMTQLKPQRMLNSSSDNNIQNEARILNKSRASGYGKSSSLPREVHLIKVKKKINHKPTKVKQLTDIDVPDDPTINSQISILSKGVTKWLGVAKLK